MGPDAGRAQGSGTERRWPPWLAARVGIDARGLAALRIALALLLLADLGLRAGDLVAHYTDAGVLPRSALAAVYPAFAGASLHAQVGAPAAIAGLFGIAALLAVALLIGYRTRLALLGSLVLLVSLQLRNPLVLNAGDSLLVRLLVWSVFLPLGGRWAVDSVRHPGLTGRVTSLATVALLLQVVVVYTTNAAFKLQGAQWRAGAAIRTAFALDQLTVGLGDVLASYPTLLVQVDRLWLAMLLASVLLVVLTGRARTALVLAFAGAHIGMALTLRLGLFPLISIVALLPFLPAPVWDRLERATPAAIGGRLSAAIRGLAGGLPTGPRLAVPVGWRGRLAQVGTAVVAILFVIMLTWNAATLGVVGLPAGVTDAVDPDEYRWDMFAPEPRADDGWYVVPGQTASGRTVAAFRGGPADFTRPAELAATFPSHRWFVYLLDLRSATNAPLRDDFGAYLCDRWDASHDDELASLTIYYVEERVRLDGPESRDRRLLARHTCDG